MQLTLNVGVDYEELAEYLQQHYYHNADTPLPTAAFDHVRGVLAQHVEDMLDVDNNASDTGLTDILLRHFHAGTIDDIYVTKAPGYVSCRHGRTVMLPLVLIQVSY